MTFVTGGDPDIETCNQIIKIFTIDSIIQKMRLDNDFLYTDYYVFEDEVDDRHVDSIVKVIKPGLNNAFKSLTTSVFPSSDSLAPKVKQRNYELVFRTADISLDIDNRFLNLILPVYFKLISNFEPLVSW